MMNGTLGDYSPGTAAWANVLTPVYLKAIKDIFFLLSVFLFLVDCIKSPKSMRIYSTRPFVLLNIFSVLLVLSSLYSLIFMSPDIVLMGVRGYWAIGFVYIGALYCNLDERKFHPYILAVFALQLVLQIVQVITGVGFLVYSEYRNPGLFIIPSAAGAFALLVHYVAVRRMSQTLKVLSVLSLVLSNSTAGILILIAYYIFVFRNKLRPKLFFYPLYFVIVSLVCYGVLANLGTISGRGSGASSSALTRLGVIYLALSNWTSLIFGNGMGMATSQAVLTGYSGAIIADNTYIGILYNAGILPAILMLLFVCFSFRYFENKLLFFMFVGYSMTTVFFEINPVVQITLILLGLHIGRKHADAAKTVVSSNS
jgi:hypothetical protein